MAAPLTMAAPLLASCLFLLLASPALADEGQARILLSKQISNKYLVEGMDIVVRYNLFNVGDNAATGVQVQDGSFRQEDFDVVAGQTKFRLDRVAPGANASHTVVVRPKKFGFFNFTAAEVTYKAGESGVIVTGLSSDPGQGTIIASRDYERQFSAHLLDWAAFAVMTLPSLGIPFLLWWSSKSKYEAIMIKKDQSSKYEVVNGGIMIKKDQSHRHAVILYATDTNSPEISPLSDARSPPH